MRILVVEDEPELAEALAVGLRREGYAVDVATRGDEAVERLATSPYDLVTLDLGLPDMDGRDIARAVRSQTVTDEPGPRVLMLTARDRLEDRVAGLDVGADDYLVKSFAFAELLARVRALLRRDVGSNGAVLRLAKLELDAARLEASHDGVELALTAKEFALLRFFMLHPGEVLSAERLLDHVWDEHVDPFTNTVRVTVSNLRRKLKEAGADDSIETVVGAGYRLRDMR
ncbi:MAG TPA: response regulator transcription factor [Acidimicrobiia bacterium]